MIPQFGKQQEEEKPIEYQRTLHQSDFINGVVKRRALQDVIIVFGNGNRPTTGEEIKAHFDIGTFVFSLWTGQSWKTVTLS